METIILVVLGLILLVQVAIMALAVSGAKKWEAFRAMLETHIGVQESNIKRQQSAMAEFIIEQRRMTRVMSESLELKKAEMTGDFEIVEEPIPVAAPPPGAPTIQLSK